MLTHTFAHFPGVTLAREAELWDDGYFCWDDLIAKANSGGGLGGPGDGVTDEAIRSRQRLAAGDAGFFRERLPSSARWRAYPEFIDGAAFLDIETTGLSPGYSYTTLVGILDGDGYTAYLRGDNLDDLPEALLKYDLVVTFNGASFDLPFLRREFQASEEPDAEDLFARAVHIDLRYPLRQAGYTGGLKRIEKRTGLGRSSALSKLGGADAVTLWKMAGEGEPGAIETLVRYNAEDVASLPDLARLAYDMLSSRLPFSVPPAPRFPDYDTESLPYDSSLVEYLARFS
ncbi:MAG: ribonuclease H-like domain-containing protein [Chloroflexi bacterium]|nr:ribonuclease H-like domain-containing protein [Chloroflexota bacterium]